MPIKKRSSANTSKSATPHYVFVNPAGGLIIRTPAACTYWDNDFRARVTAGYAKPKTAKLRSAHYEQYVKHDYDNKEYKVAKQRLKLVHIIEDMPNSPVVVVLRTEVHNLTTGKKLYLNHDDPAMRMLMIYVFITGTFVYGVPQLHIADIDEEW